VMAMLCRRARCPQPANKCAYRDSNDSLLGHGRPFVSSQLRSYGAGAVA
jgi:hypothetical protein